MRRCDLPHAGTPRAADRPSGPDSEQTGAVDLVAHRRKLGRAIRAHREAAGITKQRFCMSIGLSRPALDCIERGEAAVKLDTLERIAEGLGVDAWRLLH